MFQVRDGSRTLQFDGRLLATSSSWRRGSDRWVEFKLYQTDKDHRYIISRTGMSLLYHLPDCAVVNRNNLREAPASELDKDARPCVDCRPDRNPFPIICPERPRYWAQVCDTADAVIDALTKYDEAGNRYLTFVAQRLLDQASDEDDSISRAYRVQTIT